jgi:hypothetical protein
MALKSSVADLTAGRQAFEADYHNLSCGVDRGPFLSCRPLTEESRLS